LVGGTHDEGAEGSRGELHQVDRDHAPGALDAELLEEGGGDDGVAGGVSVWIQKRAADDRDEDYGEAAAEDLRAVPDYGAARHGAEVRYYLRDGHGVRAEIVLIGQHGWVEILGAVGLEDLLVCVDRQVVKGLP